MSNQLDKLALPQRPSTYTQLGRYSHDPLLPWKHPKRHQPQPKKPKPHDFPDCGFAPRPAFPRPALQMVETRSSLQYNDMQVKAKQG